MAELTDGERTEFEARLAQLRDYGYVDIESHGNLHVGARVRHAGHQWPDAYTNGTGEVLAITERPDSAWSRSWGRRDVELIVLWDRVPFGSRLSDVAQYHVEAITRSGQDGNRS